MAYGEFRPINPAPVPKVTYNPAVDYVRDPYALPAGALEGFQVVTNDKAPAGAAYCKNYLGDDVAISMEEVRRCVK